MSGAFDEKGELFPLMDAISDKASDVDGVPRFRGDVKIVLTVNGPMSSDWATGAFIGEHEVPPVAGITPEMALQRLLGVLQHRA